jgi:peptidoglycan hydrolase CwlO-like protein
MTRLSAVILIAAATISTSILYAAEKSERHPHIRAAIKELREAKKELQEAAHDFGGHRVDAVKAIDEAEKHLAEALKFDKK